MLNHNRGKRQEMILPPPPQIDRFGGGGVEILDFFHKFFFFCDKIFVEASLGQTGTPGHIFDSFRPIPATTEIFKFQKITKFRVFKPNLATFFFQSEIFVQNCPQNTKNGFLEFL